jgi:hypothetical protein
MSLKSQFFLLLFVLLSNYLFAQKDVVNVKLPIQMSIPSGASLSLTGSDLQFSIKGKGAEQIITPSTVGSVWINYSSVVDVNSTNAISANLSTWNLPAEVAITLKVGPDAGVGYGQTGTASNSIVLSPNPQVIISNIGTCFTGQGINKGRELSYTWVLRPGYDDEILTADDLVGLRVAVTYTISSSK